MDRRSFGAGIAAALLGGAGIYAWRVAPIWLETVTLRVAIPGLPTAWDGVRIAHLSDFHVGGPRVPPAMLRRAKDVALAFRPDLVALTGDFHHDGLSIAAGDLLSAWPGAGAVFAVLGNHDHRGGIEHLERLRALLRQAGVCLLDNAATSTPLRGREAWIAGVDDPWTLRADEAAALGALPPDQDALLLLAHSPAAIERVPPGRVALVLAGHTHGGQVRLLPSGAVPFYRQLRWLTCSPERRDSPVHRGVHWRNGAVLVISNGLGVARLSLRFLTRPQVVLIELVRAAEDGPPCDDVARYVERLDQPPAWLRWLS